MWSGRIVAVVCNYAWTTHKISQVITALFVNVLWDTCRPPLHASLQVVPIREPWIPRRVSRPVLYILPRTGSVETNQYKKQCTTYERRTTGTERLPNLQSYRQVTVRLRLVACVTEPFEPRWPSCPSWSASWEDRMTTENRVTITTYYIHTHLSFASVSQPWLAVRYRTFNCSDLSHRISRAFQIPDIH